MKFAPYLLLLFSQLCFGKFEIVPIDGKIFLPASKSAQVLIRPKNILAYVEKESGLHLFPKKVGQVTVTVDAVTREFQIVERTTFNFFNATAEHLKSRMGLHMQIQNGVPVLLGQLHRLRDWIEISNLATSSGSIYQFKASVDEDVRDKVHGHIKAVLNASGFNGFQVHWSPNVSVRIAQAKKADLDRANSVLATLGITAFSDSGQIAVEPLVQVNITVAELSRRLQEDLGIQWPTEAQFQLAPRFSAEQGLAAFLKAAVAKGEAQVLANPRLVAKSGGSAEFLAGGEFPIRISDRGKKDIFWKRHGIYMKILPKADVHNHLQLDIVAEVSMPEASYEGESVPALRTNRIASQFDLEGSRTIVLSGLVQDLRSSSNTGPFGLAHIPILGRLFRSESFKNHRTELVIFVTPEVINPAADFTPNMPEGFVQDVRLRQ